MFGNHLALRRPSLKDFVFSETVFYSLWDKDDSRRDCVRRMHEHELSLLYMFSFGRLTLKDNKMLVQ